MQVNDFMQALQAEMVEKRGIKDSTSRKYIADLYRLNGGKPFKSLGFLKDREAIEGCMASKALNTRITLLSGIVSALDGKRAYKRVADQYRTDLFALTGDLKEEVAERDGGKTEREAANWVDWKDVEARREELKGEVAALPEAGPLTAKQWDTLQRYLVICLYTMTPPRRNLDYLEMVVSRNGKHESVEHNYYLPKEAKFVFNIYKTAKTHGAQTLDVPADLAAVLARYLRQHPLGKGKGAALFKLLVRVDGTPVAAGNSITRMLNKVFGGKVGASLLRHSYLSSKYDLEDMQEDADAMGHSMQEQRAYLRKDA